MTDFIVEELLHVFVLQEEPMCDEIVNLLRAYFGRSYSFWICYIFVWLMWSGAMVKRLLWKRHANAPFRLLELDTKYYMPLPGWVFRSLVVFQNGCFSSSPKERRRLVLVSYGTKHKGTKVCMAWSIKTLLQFTGKQSLCCMQNLQCTINFIE